jgi:hypothetical protein
MVNYILIYSCISHQLDPIINYRTVHFKLDHQIAINEYLKVIHFGHNSTLSAYLIYFESFFPNSKYLQSYLELPFN